jgi:8-oxo-dGTP diphosphatase
LTVVFHKVQWGGYGNFLEIEVGKHLITIDHTYNHLRVTLTVHHCRHLTGFPQAIECDEVRWVNLDELEQFEFPQANTQIIAALREWKIGNVRIL